MSQVLLWISFVISIAVCLSQHLFHFPPSLVRKQSEQNSGDATEALTSTAPASLVWCGYLVPFLGCLLSLPVGGIFSAGQQLGFGFLIGGVAAVLARSGWTRAANGQVLASMNGGAVGAVSAVLLFLPASRIDALMGAAMGWFCSTIAFLLAVPVEERPEGIASRLSAATGMMVTLTAGVILGIFRDPISSSLPKLTWSAVLIAMTAFGVLLQAGVAWLPLDRANRWHRIAPLFILVGGTATALYLLNERLTGNHRLTGIGLGGLILLPVLAAVLVEARRRTDLRTMTLLPVVLLTTGFLAALQTFQGTGVAVFVLVLYIVFPSVQAVTAIEEEESATDNFRANLLNLLLFGTQLVLWRLFTTRFSGELRGVNLTDQYALFGLVFGAALPSLLSALIMRWRTSSSRVTGMGIVVLAITTFFTLATPALALILFGAKCITGLLIGLALGVALSPLPASPLPALTAIAVALVVSQWTGHIIPENGFTRVDKIRWLIGVVALLVPVALLSDWIMGSFERRDTK